MDQRVMRLTDTVVDAINEELAYVATLSEQGRSDTVHYGTAGQLLTLSTYTQRAIDAWTENPGNDGALHNLRKVAAIAVRALLTEGCPRRGGSTDNIFAKETLGVVEETFESDAAVGGV